MCKTEEQWLIRIWWKNKSGIYRYFALLNLSIYGFGAFVAEDSLGAFQKSIMTNMNLSAQDFSYLYSIGCWPAIPLCFFGGFLIDKVFGIRLSTVIYSLVIFFGHLIFSIGVLFNSFWCALVGRFFHSIGLEFVNICQMYYLVVYFKGKELGMVQCLTFALSRLGSSAVFEMAYPILTAVRSIYSGSKEVGIVIFIVGSFTVGSVICALILLFMNPNDNKAEMKKERDMVKMSDILHFGIQFWLSAIGGCALNNNIFMLITFSQGFFTSQYGMTKEEANTVSSIFSLMGAASAFPIGIIIDKIGYEVTFQVLGFIVAVISHLILAFTLVTPFFSTFLLAVSNNMIIASLCPLYTYIVEEKMLGTAYGTAQAMMSLCFSSLIIVAGMVVDNYGYQALEIFIFGNMFVGLLTASVLWIYNFINKGNLNLSSSQRKKAVIKENQTKELTRLRDRSK